MYLYSNLLVFSKCLLENNKFMVKHKKKVEVIKKPINNISLEIKKLFAEIPIIYNKYF